STELWSSPPCSGSSSPEPESSPSCSWPSSPESGSSLPWSSSPSPGSSESSPSPGPGPGSVVGGGSSSSSPSPPGSEPAPSTVNVTSAWMPPSLLSAAVWVPSEPGSKVKYTVPLPSVVPASEASTSVPSKMRLAETFSCPGKHVPVIVTVPSASYVDVSANAVAGASSAQPPSDGPGTPGVAGASPNATAGPAANAASSSSPAEDWATVRRTDIGTLRVYGEDQPYCRRRRRPGDLDEFIPRQTFHEHRWGAHRRSL